MPRFTRQGERSFWAAGIGSIRRRRVKRPLSEVSLVGRAPYQRRCKSYVSAGLTEGMNIACA